MTVLKASVTALLSLSASLACAQAAPTIEQRLQQLEAEQAAMKQQLAERDRLIEDLRKELQAQGAATAAVAPVAAPTPARPETPPGSAAAPEGTQQARSVTEKGSVPEIDTFWGEFNPGQGFLVGRSDLGELDISGYALARYMDQNDSDGVFKDHLGNTRPVDGRNDIMSHRIMLFFKGWLVDPKLVYNITLWTVNATDQRAIFANLGYQFSRKFSLYAGLVGNPGSRSLLGSHPYWLGNDRVMADEFFRPYFGSAIYASGEALPGLWYQATVANNNSALGVKATQLDRKMTVGGTLWWMPTTHEFGPRGGYGDWEWHDSLATRFGVSAVYSPEQSFRDAEGTSANTTLRLADSVNLFETGALAPGVTVDNADYQIVSVDAGMKYKGMFLQAEYYWRTLDKFVADGLLPVRQIKDDGFYVQGSFYPVPKVLELYAATSQIFGDSSAGFGDSSEYLVGMNWYPFDTRNHRLNLQLMDVNKSPVSSTFGYYTAGQDGWTVATAFSVFF
ncbi:MAG TPA: porin [Steroidobacteraceae bacterium]